MARVGRKPFRLKHLDRLAASPLAKIRLEWLLKSLSGECTVPEACAALGINESRFHQLRGDWLQAAAASLEPGRPGPRPKEASPEAAEIAALEGEVRGLKLELHASQVRAELAEALPHVVGLEHPAGKKTTGTAAARPARSSRKKSRRK
jgi:hypothetical protein